MKNALWKNTLREIRGSFGRYMAILAIVGLGVGFYAGLSVTQDAMLKTGEEYFKEHKLYDLRFISTLGLRDADVSEIEKLPFVTQAEGAYSADALINIGDGGDSAKILSFSDRINVPVVTHGRMIENANECLIDENWATEDVIGKKLTIADSNKETTLDLFNEREFTVVGLCKSVLYVNYERGATSIGDGTLSGFVYVSDEAFNDEYYTEVYALTTAEGKIYSDKYNDAIEEQEDEAKTLLEKLASDKYDEIYTEASDKINDAKEQLADANAEIADNEKKIADAEKEISDGESKISDGYSKLDDARDQLEAMKAFIPAAVYEAQLKEIEDGEKELKENEKALDDARRDIEEAKTKIADAKEEIAVHEEELKDGEDKLNDLKKPDTYVLTRAMNIGYACFESDSAIVDGVADVFPVFFFLVAALVCMTTMNRMIEEQRTQVGVMKALGYSERSIMGKYLFYSGSAAMVGCVGGFYAGSVLFPKVIWEAYKIMYNMKPIEFVFNTRLAVISLIVSILCSMGATYATLAGELRSQAAELIRPKAPANGKRVLMERITFIWKRLSFTAKVSVRNVFRYKKRFFMMVLGVGGCYALLVTGMGLRDSITGITDNQFKKIQNIDITVSFKDSVSAEDLDAFKAALAADDISIYSRVKSVDLVFDGKQKSTILSVFSDEDPSVSGADFMNFMDEKEKPLTLPGDGEVLISLTMAEDLGIKIGDEVILRDADLKEIKVKVSAIMLNYVNNLAYVSKETYEAKMDEEFAVNTAYVRTNSDVHELGAALSELDGVMSVSITEELVNRVDNMLKSMDYVVLLTVFSSAALAFIVMYNLTNINITERLREIATLKVLGFYPKETNIYVFRENFVLTAIGIVAGFFMGIGLHRYVMSNIKVDLVSFDVHIEPVSFLIAVGLTFVYAILVDFVLAGKLERIHMAESLKSVE